MLEKLGEFSVLATGNSFNYQTNDEVLNQSFNGNFVYSNSFFTQYLVEMNNIMQDTDNGQETIKEYLSNNNVYIQYNDGKTISQTAEDTRGFGYANTMGQSYIALLDSYTKKILQISFICKIYFDSLAICSYFTRITLHFFIKVMINVSRFTIFKNFFSKRRIPS